MTFVKIFGVVLNTILPGIGTLAIGKWRLGAVQVLLGSAAIAIAVDGAPIPGAIAAAAVWIWSLTTVLSLRRPAQM